MQEIVKFNDKLTRQRKTTTILVGALLLGGFSLSIPLFNDSIKYQETLYCNIKSSCKGIDIKRGVSFLVDRERRNLLFDQHIKILKVLRKEDDTAVYFGILSSALLLTAYGVSKTLTNHQEKAVHSQFKLLKIKALENDLLEQTHIDLFGFTKTNQAEITKQAIARHTSETIQAMKSEGELQLDHLNGRLQGQLSLKNHEFKLSELDKAIAENQLSTAETMRKLDKINKPVANDKQPSASEELKNAIIEALKSHEGGWLWFIISALKPLWLVGNPGSGKTTTAAAIALIRKYCNDSPVYYIIDRHAIGDNAEKWELLKAEKSAKTEVEITAAMQDTIIYWSNRIKESPKGRTQIIIDEYTSLGKLIGDLADTWFKLSISDCRKAKCNLIGITHNATNSSFPEKTLAERTSSTILIQKFSANGETPLDRVVIRYGLVDEKGNNLEDVEKTLPSWFRPEKIYNHFNGKPIEFE